MTLSQQEGAIVSKGKVIGGSGERPESRDVIESLWHEDRRVMAAIIAGVDEPFDDHAIRANLQRLVARGDIDRDVFSALVQDRPLSEADPDVIEKIRDYVEEKYNEVSDAVYQQICDEWRYCERRDKYGSEQTLATALLEWLVQAGIGVGFPVATFVIYGVKVAILDRVCGC